ncbi:MAG: MerR family transcriptional regulator [Thermomicrobiales bacterium]
MSGSFGNGRSVGQIAKLSGVTIRTLHHHEQIALLIPSGRTDAGYRIYSDTDCDRLSRILYYRVLGFPLDAIGAMLDAGDPDTVEAEHRQDGARFGDLPA